MKAVAKCAAVIVLVLLVIAGLNTSSHGISQLTMTGQGPVFAIHRAGGEIQVTALGQARRLNPSTIHEMEAFVKQQGMKLQGEMLERWRQFRCKG